MADEGRSGESPMAGLFGKAKEFLQSEQGGKVADQVLDTAAQFASKQTGGKHDEQIAKARKVADEQLGRLRGEGGAERGDRT